MLQKTAWKDSTMESLINQPLIISTHASSDTTFKTLLCKKEQTTETNNTEVFYKTQLTSNNGLYKY